MKDKKENSVSAPVQPGPRPKRGYWQCTNCPNIEDKEREVHCWECGKGEMVYVPFPAFPVAAPSALTPHREVLQRIQELALACIDTHRTTCPNMAEIQELSEAALASPSAPPNKSLNIWDIVGMIHRIKGMSSGEERQQWYDEIARILALEQIESLRRRVPGKGAQREMCGFSVDDKGTKCRKKPLHLGRCSVHFDSPAPATVPATPEPPKMCAEGPIGTTEGEVYSDWGHPPEPE